MISLIIIWILIVITFKIYKTVIALNIRAENEKILFSEIIYFSQFLDNLTTNYKLYTGMNITSKNITNKLILENLQNPSKKIEIYQTGDCSITNRAEIKNKKCWIEINLGYKKFPLTNPDKIFVQNLYFKIIGLNSNNFENTYTKGFGVSSYFYIKNYSDKTWELDIKKLFENFYRFTYK